MDSIDDVEEMQIMDEAFDILGFKLEEKVITFSSNINMAARASNFSIYKRPFTHHVSKGWGVQLGNSEHSLPQKAIYTLSSASARTYDTYGR